MLLTTDELDLIDKYLKPDDRRWVKLHLQLCQETDLDRLQVTDEHLGITLPPSKTRQSDDFVLDTLIWGQSRRKITKKPSIEQAAEIYSAESNKPIRTISYAESVEESSNKKKNAREQFIADYCRPAQVSDYQEWFDKYFLRQDINPQWNTYKYPMPSNEVFVLESLPRKIPKLCGANSLMLLIPGRIHSAYEKSREDYASGLVGHNEFFSLSRGWYVGPRKFMPIYSDMRINYKARATSIA